jgi:cytochrome c biogenesis protein CcmG/thiol:disulfide interchange protein DsbE
MVRSVKILIVTVMLVSGLAAVGCSGGGDSGGLPAPGRPAPDFKLQSLDGQTVSLSALKGRPVLVNFWATWCGPCQMEIPILQQLAEDTEWRERGLVMLAVNLGESPSLVREFVEVFGISFPVLLDTSQEVAIAYNAAYIPVTYFIDKDGIINDIKVGAIANRIDLELRLKKLIMNDEP